jgi:acetyl esterase/lipase
MISRQARLLWELFRNGPRMIELPLAERRAAAIGAEEMTTEPEGVTFADAGLVDGLWANPDDHREGAGMLYLYGGGYAIGTPETRRKTAGHLAAATGARVLVPSYRLAPEHPFPAALDDAVAAWTWMVSQNTSAARSTIAGDSAGGGLAVATALALRDRALPAPAGVVALSPWTDLSCGGETMATRAAADLCCTQAGLAEMGRWYAGAADLRTPLVSPNFADLSRLPPLLCLAGGDEVLLDDAVRLVKDAGMSGTNATLFIGAGMQHVWPIWAGLLPEADAAMALIGGWVRGLGSK